MGVGAPLPWPKSGREPSEKGEAPPLTWLRQVPGERRFAGCRGLGVGFWESGEALGTIFGAVTGSVIAVLRMRRPASVLHNASSGCKARGRTPKSELGFSMTLAQATPGIRPEGRRLGTLRLGRRLDPQKIGLNPRAKVAAVEVSAL